MDDLGRDLREMLDREIELHRDLLALARTRNLLLRQGRHADLPPLRRAEGPKVDELRQLEQLRSRFGDGMGAPAVSAEIAEAATRIAGLLRQLGAVERANRVLLSRAAIRTASLGEGIGVWAGAPIG